MIFHKTCDPLCHSALSSRFSLCHLIINKMFWHLLSLFAAATPTCATPRQSLKRCLKSICIFFNQSTRVSCLAVVNVFPACSSPFAPGVPGELFYCRRSFGLMRGRRAEHESRLIYLNVFECEATSLFLSLSHSLVCLRCLSTFCSRKGGGNCGVINMDLWHILGWVKAAISIARCKQLSRYPTAYQSDTSPWDSILDFAIKFTFSVATATQQSGKTQI